MPSLPTILVTGGAGFIGSITARRLLDNGYQVCVLDNLSTGHRTSVDKRAHFFEGDIADKKLLQTIVSEHHPEAIFHFAAASLVAESVTKPDFYKDNNFVRATKLAHHALELGIQKFIFSSTAAVYGEPKRVPILETDACQPVNPYGETKRLFEQELLALTALKKVIFRYFNVAGAWPDGSLGERHEPETHLIPKMLRDAKADPDGMKVSVFGTDYPTKDGTCVRDYLHVLDIADAHILGLQKIDSYSGEVFNLGSAQGFSVLDVVETIRSTLRLPINVMKKDRRPGDPAILIADSSKARKLLEWKPARENLSLMIEDCWKSLHY